jgi:uncharacterized protein YbjQ (UPF0145 family)
MTELNNPLDIPLSTTDHIAGAASERHVGGCFGLVARSMGFSKAFKGGFKAYKRGEVKEFTETLEAARRVAVERMVAHAVELGGNAVVGVRFDSTDMGEQQGMAEIVAYGTAIFIE